MEIKEETKHGLVDCHVHIDDDQFKDELQNILKESATARIERIVCVSMDYQSSEKVLKLSQSYPNVLFPCAGLHPVSVTQLSSIPSSSTDLSPLELEMEKISNFVQQNHKHLVAIGEVGLDFSPWLIKTESDKEIQMKIFEQHILLGKKYNLPLNVHSRNAGHYTIEVLIKHNYNNAVLHAFDGKPNYAVNGAKFGLYFSVPPSIVRDTQMPKLIKQIPLANLLLESDAPSLPPVKNTKNYPKNCALSLNEISKIKQMDIQVVQKQIYMNSLQLFPKLSLST